MRFVLPNKATGRYDFKALDEGREIFFIENVCVVADPDELTETIKRITASTNECLCDDGA